MATALTSVKKDRPCDACRRRKMRCLSTSDGKACALCQSRSQDCTFLQDPPRKKRRTETEESSPDISNTNPWQHAKAGTIQGKLPINDYDSLPGPSLLKQTLGHQNRSSVSYLGISTGEFDVDILKLSPFDSKGEFSTNLGTFRRVSQNVANQQTHFIMKSDAQTEVSWEMERLDAIEAVVAPHGPALVDIYFRIVHPSFPVLHKKVFLEKYDRSYREQTPLGLIAVYVLALNWWQYSLELSSTIKPDIKELERMLPQLFSECYRRPKISDLQAGLVLLQRPEAESWMTGQLVTMAQHLGLHDDCSNWNIPDWERGVRKRVAWALFAQDKWSALIHGRPSLIMAQNWDVQALEVRDFPETAVDDNDEEGSAEVEKGRLIFVNLISLTKILADVLNAFFTLKESKRSGSTIEALEKAKPLQLRLKSWHAELPAQLSMDVSKARKLSSTGYLHLAYFALEVTLHRAIIRSTAADSQLRHITRAAALTRLTSGITFLESLKPQHLQSFWYFASKMNLAIIGTFGMVLWATSESAEESEVYKSHLSEYRWTLRISSTGAAFMRYAVEVLDASKVFVGDLTSKKGAALKRDAMGDEQVSQDNGHSTVQLQYSPDQEGILNNNGLDHAADASIATYSDFNWQDLDPTAEVSRDWFQDFSNLVDNGSFQINEQLASQYNGNTQNRTESGPYNDGYYVG